MKESKDTKYTHADRAEIYERLVNKPISTLAHPDQYARVSKVGMPTPEGKVYKDDGFENRTSEINYKRLKSVYGSFFDDEGKKIIEDILSVWDDGHCIYICHPNHIFAGNKLITKDNREIKNINWNDIDINKMFRINDYKTFISPEYYEAFKYIHNRLGHQILGEVKKGNKDTAVSYLAVVEKYRFDYEDYYLIRGIIRGDYEGYSIAFNPEYQNTIPKSVWDKSLRFSGHEVPKIYSLKRKK